MKRFYVEEDDNGKEIKRKLTTFANDDLTQLSDDELETLYYESSAQFLAKAMHFMKIDSVGDNGEAFDLLDDILSSLEPSKEYLYKQRLKRKMQREAMR